ncbi:MAG TPA: lipopolysaccharide biosynthesis protein [Gemmatimonadales bacterium]
MSGIAWTGGVKWFTQILSWSSMIIIAHLLAPAEFGLYGMALVFLGLVDLVSELGLSAAIVQKKNLTADQVAQLGSLSLLFAIVLVGLTLAVATPLAAFFGQPRLRWLVVLMSANMVVKGCAVASRASLAKELRFRELAVIDGVQALTLTVATLALAVAGLGAWALALGAVLANVIGSILTLVIRPQRLSRPRDLRSLEPSIWFGLNVAAARLSWYAYSNADFAIVGRVLGAASLGAYTIGWNLASIPVDRLTALLGNVTPAVFAASQDDPSGLRRYITGLTEGIALLTFPLAVGLALTADLAVPLILGERWLPAVVPLRLLALASVMRSVAPLAGTMLQATGHARMQMRLTTSWAVLFPVMFYFGAKWRGTEGVAWAWIAGQLLIITPSLAIALRRAINLRPSDYARTLIPATTGTAAMAIAVLGIRALVPASWSPAIRLSAAVVTGVATYAGVTFLAHRDRLVRFRNILRPPKAAARVIA